MENAIESYLLFSSARPFIEKDEIKAIIEESIKKNELNNITGFLYYRDPYFIHYIEGQSAIIEKLKQQVLLDSRHQVKHWLNDRNKQRRRFNTFITQEVQLTNSNRDVQATAILIMDTLVLALRTFMEKRVPIDGGSQRLIFEKIDNLAKMFDLLNNGLEQTAKK